MQLKHRLARLERAVAERRRPVEEAADCEDRMQAMRELHADPLRLALIRSAWDAKSDPLPEGVSREELLRERLARVEAYGGPAPEGAAVILQYQLERMEKDLRGWGVYECDLADNEDVMVRLRDLRADPVALGLLQGLLRLIPNPAMFFTRLHLVPEGAELLARLKAHQASKGAAACA